MGVAVIRGNRAREAIDLAQVVSGFATYTLLMSAVAVMTTRWLTPADRGSLMILTSAANLVALVGSGGLGTHTRVGMTQAGCRLPTRRIAGLIGFGFLWTATLSTIVAFALLVRATGPLGIVDWLLFVFISCFQGIAIYLRELTFACGRYGIASHSFNASALGQVALVTALAVTARLTLTSALLSWLLSIAGLVALLGLGLRHPFYRALPVQPSIEGNVAMVASSFKAVPVAIRSQVVSTVERISLGLLSTPSNVAIYGTAATYASIGALVSSGGSQLVQQRAGQRVGSGRIRRMQRGIFLLQALVLSTLGLASSTLIPWIFGSEYVASVPASIVLLFASAGYAVAGLCISELAGQGRYSLGGQLAALQILSVVALQAILVRPLGVMGAAYANLMTGLMSAAIASFAASRGRARAVLQAQSID